MEFIRRKRRTNKAKVRRRNILNIVTILSCLLVILKLLFIGVIGIGTAAMILLAITVFVAIGNPYTKLALILIGLYLFIKSKTGMDAQAFQHAIVNVGALALVLIGLYVMIKSIFK